MAPDPGRDESSKSFGSRENARAQKRKGSKTITLARPKLTCRVTRECQERADQLELIGELMEESERMTSLAIAVRFEDTTIFVT